LFFQEIVCHLYEDKAKNVGIISCFLQYLYFLQTGVITLLDTLDSHWIVTTEKASFKKKTLKTEVPWLPLPIMFLESDPNFPISGVIIY